ncbi:MAG: hypothetical protein ACMUHY_00725 [Thermoplasmatota archaeon]
MTGAIFIDTGAGSGMEQEADPLIEATPFRGHALNDIMSGISSVWSGIAGGSPPGSYRSPLEKMGFDDVQSSIIVDIAKTRKNAGAKYADGRSLFFTSEGLRWATPDPAARHCALRISRALVMDVTCGQGGQVLALCELSERVIAVDIDPLNCLLTSMNCIAKGITNALVVNSDCLDSAVIGLAEEGCAIFSDPARPPSSTERTFEEIVPDPREVMNAFDHAAGGMCFEVPPYISPGRIDIDCEAEYVSLDGRLNRLNLYTGDLVLGERSAVVLPSGATLRGRFSDRQEHSGSRRYVHAHEIDPAVVKAGLADLLPEELGIDGSLVRLDDRRSLLLSDELTQSPFLINSYRILADPVTEKDLDAALRRVGAGSVTIRYPVEPGEYWTVRRGLEKDLTGNRKVQLFKGDAYMILEKLG